MAEGSFKRLAKYLTKGCKNDVQKLRALFVWSASIDTNRISGYLNGDHLKKRDQQDSQKGPDDDSPPDQQGSQKGPDAGSPPDQQGFPRRPDTGSPLDCLLKISWGLFTYAQFFVQLCRAANLQCIIVTGVTKNSAYEPGEEIDYNNLKKQSQWNAVYCDREWRFVDLLWASSRVVGKQAANCTLIERGDDDKCNEQVNEKQYHIEGRWYHQTNEFFFLTDPDQLILTHYPKDPAWQLLQDPVSTDYFQEHVYIRERFFELGMSMTYNSKIECIQQTRGGETNFEFNIPINNDVRFSYRLYNTNPQESNAKLDRCIFYEKKNSCISYRARFPIEGEFNLLIFGEKKSRQRDEKTDDETKEGKTNKVEMNQGPELCAFYKIECHDPKKNADYFPDSPENGWGPSDDAEKAGMTPITHEDGLIETQDGCVEIRFALENPVSAMKNLKNNDLDDWLLKKNAMLRVDGEELVVNLRLPVKGEYALNLFGDQPDKVGDFPNVCNYLIKCIRNNDCEAFPKLHEGIIGKGYLAEKLTVTAISHKEDTIKTDTGILAIKFDTNEDVELFCELQHNDIDRNALMNAMNIESSGRDRDIGITLPIGGEYALNIFARDKNDDNRVYHVYTYLIVSTQPTDEEIDEPLEDISEQALEVECDTVEIRLPAGQTPKLAELQKKNAQEGIATADQITSRREGDEDVFVIKLPSLGEYKIEVFETRPNKALATVALYKVTRHETPVEPPVEEGPLHCAIRERLRKATEDEDMACLISSIKEFKDKKLVEKDDDLTRAESLLKLLTVSKALSDAMAARDLSMLNKAIRAAEQPDLARKLGLKLEMAKAIRDQLLRIKKLKAAILDLDSKTIAEIKSYSKPPAVVNSVLKATFLLLGETEATLKDWKSIVVLIGKTGKESFKRRIKSFEPEQLDIELAVKVKPLITKYSEDDVSDVSAGSVCFYSWSCGMIAESESRFVTQGGDLKTVRPRTARLA